MYINDYWKQFDQIELKWHYLNASIYSAIGLLSLIANTMVLLYIFRVKNKKQRPNGIIFSTNLALADIGKATINLPMTSISSFYGEWIFDQIGCEIYGLFGGLFGFISITTLVFMSLERYIIVKSPLNMECFNVKTKLICITFIWIYSAFLIVIQLFSKNGFVLEGMLTSCSFDYLSRDLISRFCMLLMLIGGFIIPLMLIIVFYVLTKNEIKKKQIFFSNEFK